LRSNPGNFGCDTKSWGRFAPLSRRKAAPTMIACTPEFPVHSIRIFNCSCALPMK